MPFTEPIRTDDPIETVRMIARLANLLLDLRTEYERRQKPAILLQIKERAAELNDLANRLPVEGELPPHHQAQG
ncbi:MAG TPA: hypothetical protein VH186_02360 [Chloroflexia bacterium]|nr:hypothetical protein [Chloroflexia bacterium]